MTPLPDATLAALEAAAVGVIADYSPPHYITPVGWYGPGDLDDEPSTTIGGVPLTPNEAAFIGAASPDAVLALVAELRHLRALVEREAPSAKLAEAERERDSAHAFLKRIVSRNGCTPPMIQEAERLTGGTRRG